MNRTSLRRGALFLSLLILLFFSSFYVYHNIAARSIFPPDVHASDYWGGIVIDNKLEPVFLGYDPGVVNMSRSESIILQSISFPNGLPAHLHVGSEVIMLGSEQPSGQPTDIRSGSGWPPNFHGHPILTHQLSSFQLEPLHIGEGLVEFVPDRSGIYIVGPFTIHAVLPGFLGSSIGSVQIDATYKEHIVICIQVDPTICDAAMQGKPK